MLIGTAGHIDHGKTTLVRALTGVDTTRLPEERKRGMTIELGYAYAPIPDGDGRMLAFIDVPGHEKFVPTMLTGAAGIDFALLVIAADDGPMPQTLEHLAILRLLGIRQGAVAITKCDRVDAARIAAVETDIRRLLAGTPLADAPLFATSAPEGTGIDALHAHLCRHACEEREPAATGGFRLAVDRHFAIAGAGTVVTGTAYAGQIRVGDTMLLARGDGFRREVRVRGLHVSNQPAAAGHAGQRCAVNLSGIEHRDIERGDWLCSPALARATDRIDVQLHILPDAPRALGHWQGVHLHHAAGQVQARIALLDDTLARGGAQPGESVLVQAVLAAPTLACWNDRIILRDAAGRVTLGGGRVLDPFAPARHRRRAARLALLAALARPDPAVRLLALLDAAPLGLDSIELANAHNLAIDDWLARVPAGSIHRVNDAKYPRLFSTANWEALANQVLARLALHHTQFADEVGVERERLRRMCAPQLPAPVFLARLNTLADSGRLNRTGSAWHLPTHSVVLSDGDRATADDLIARLHAGGFEPPWVRDLAGATGMAETDIRQLLRRVAMRGEIFQVVRDLFYSAARIGELAAIAADLAGPAASGHVDEAGKIRAAPFRDRIGGGRKRAIQILEFFDRVGYTRRIGEGNQRAHVIRGEPPVQPDDSPPAASP